MPNPALEPTAVSAGSSAIAVHDSPPPWLSYWTLDRLRMRLEIHIPDMVTGMEFAKNKPPEGVTVEGPVAIQCFSVDGPSSVMVFIECARDVASTVIAAYIIARFSRFLEKKPDHKGSINRREIRFERTEIIRVIEEIRTEDEMEDSKNESNDK